MEKQFDVEHTFAGKFAEEYEKLKKEIQKISDRSRPVFFPRKQAKNVSLNAAVLCVDGELLCE